MHGGTCEVQGYRKFLGILTWLEPQNGTARQIREADMEINQEPPLGVFISGES